MTDEAADDAMRSLRERMVVEQLAPRGIQDPRVLEAMRAVPRHAFVPASRRARAYEDCALPIGEGQTISQPYIVALMSQLAGAGADDTVLEVGAGGGYQAAVLSRLAGRVVSIERVPALAEAAARRLAALGYRNVEVRVADGYAGWPEAAPFRAILVTCAADHVPQPLLDQLEVGGRLVIPVGPQSGDQELTLLEKRADGTVSRVEVAPVRFVPLLRGSGGAQAPSPA